MKPKLRLKYTDFYKGWPVRENLFSQILSELYDLEFSEDDPDLVIFLPFGHQHLKYRCRKIFITGENQRPNFNVCDYAFSFDYLDDARNYRFPLALWSKRERPLDWSAEMELQKKTRFCNFVFSNPSSPLRNQLYKKLSRYKKVDSGGRYKNNLGYRLADKHSFVSQCKFTIAYENSSYPGYVTEKIADAFAANTIGIYWGNPLVHLDFNPDSFINFYDYGSNEAVIERIIELDQNDTAYLEMLRQPCYLGNEYPKAYSWERLRNQLQTIVESDEIPVSKKSSRWVHHFRHRADNMQFKWGRRWHRWKYRLLRI